jgi:hypothetical protein
MVDVVFHLGLHKTASGTLQRQIFPRCKELRLFTIKEPAFNRFYRMVAFTDPTYFYPAKAKSLLEPYLHINKPNILSNEAFSGPLYAGIAEYGLDHRTPILDNLVRVYPQARAILIIRRQDTLSVSLYRQYLKAGGTRSIYRFFGHDSYKGFGIFPKDRFDFLPYVEKLNQFFPRGVFVLPFEDLVKSKEVFLKKMEKFIGVSFSRFELHKENVTSLSPFGLEVSRILNYFFRSYLNPAGFIPGVPYKENGKLYFRSPITYLHDHWRWKGNKEKKSHILDVGKEIFISVQESNKILDEKYNLNLKSHGYY